MESERIRFEREEKKRIEEEERKADEERQRIEQARLQMLIEVTTTCPNFFTRIILSSSASLAYKIPIAVHLCTGDTRRNSWTEVGEH